MGMGNRRPRFLDFDGDHHRTIQTAYSQSFGPPVIGYEHSLQEVDDLIFFVVRWVGDVSKSLRLEEFFILSAM